MLLTPFEYVECAKVEEAVSVLAAAGDRARVIAGGTALIPLCKHRLVAPEVLVSLARVDGLKKIDVDGAGALRLGSHLTHRAVSRSERVRERAPLLAEACGRVASPTIRSMGTLGGNLCYGESASDPSPALIALGARLVLRGARRTRTVAIEDFFVGFYETALAADEVLEEIVVPAPGTDVRWRYLKWTPRAREDKALVGLAVTLATADGGRALRSARIGLGGVNAFPVRLTATERALAGAEVRTETVARAADVAAEEVQPITDLQGSAEYRREMVRVWVRRVLSELTERS